MFPLALIPILSEGLAYFRLALLAYDAAKLASEAGQLLSTKTHDYVKHHYSIVGEDVYLYILGSETLKLLYRQAANPQQSTEAGSDESIKLTVLTALHSFEQVRANPDVTHAIVEFGYALGAAAQRTDPNFRYLPGMYLNAGVAYDIADPVLQNIDKNKASLSNANADVYGALGMSKIQWAHVTSSELMNALGVYWQGSLDNAINKEIKPHRTETFISVIQRGAFSMVHQRDYDVDVTWGVDAFSITTLMLPGPLDIRYPMRQVIETRSVTKEMVDEASRRYNIYCNQIFLSNEKAWIPHQEARFVAGATGQSGAWERKSSLSSIQVDVTSQTKKDDKAPNVVEGLTNLISTLTGGKFGKVVKVIQQVGKIIE
jgi:hypothetical protein